MGIDRTNAIVVLGAASMLGACAILPGGRGPAAGPDETAGRIVAEELSDVFANAFDPRTTTVQVTRAEDDPNVALLTGALAERGFGIQRVTTDQGARFLSLTRDVDAPENGRTAFRWAATIGPVEVRRGYVLGADGTLSTGSPLRVAGVRADFDPEALSRPELMVVDPAHRRVEYTAPMPLAVPSPVISLITPELVERVARNAARAPAMSPGASRPSVQGLNASRVETGNLFYGGASNFGSTLDERDRVDRRIIVFADDSMNLGADNRQMIREFVERTVARDDLITLVGCSNGPTALEIGNEGLALGRARRVSEELALHGIAPGRIFDEGCWSPVSAGERFPGRGVVMELWRAPA